MAISVIPVLGLDPVIRTRVARDLARTEDATLHHLSGGLEEGPREALETLMFCGESVVLDCHESLLATEIIGALVGLGVDVPAVVGVLGGAWRDVLAGEGEYVRRAGEASFAVPAAVLLGSQLEYCTSLVVPPAHPLPARPTAVAPEGACVSPRAGDLLVRSAAADPLLAALNPRAQICSWPALIEPRESVAETVPGWLAVACPDLTGVPFPEVSGVDVVRYERAFPFHRERLMTMMAETHWPGVVRVAGFVRLAGSPVVHLWEQWEQTVSLDPYEREWWLDEAEAAGFPAPPEAEGLETALADLGIGHHLAIIGRGCDAGRIEEDLDACLITEEEFLAGRWQ